MTTARTPKEIADRTREFRHLTVAHPMLMATKDALMSAIHEAPPGSIVMVFGPTGVGKTTLRNRIQQLLADQQLRMMEADPACVPFVAVEAAATDNGNFSWRDHYRRTLLALSEPMLQHKIQPNWVHMMHDSRAQQILGPRSAAIELRHALESAILHRRPVAILIDEAQHLSRIASGRRLADQLEVIKSLANCTQTVHVLLGTYDLLPLRHLNGQLVRRSLDIHFRRFRAEVPQDLRMFKNVVLSFQAHLPLDEPPDLMALWDLLYERSVGCVGILKEWLDRALIAALKEGCATMSLRHLEATALTASQCEKIAVEAHEGESQLSSADAVQSRLRALLGLPDNPGASQGQQIPRRITHKQVGRRNPKRDPVGFGHNVRIGVRHAL
jgi:energy-coupling factor transporter ATP-binding protein EcfA2